MAKQPYIVQVQEDHPHSPGWWRYSRPRLRWMRSENTPFGDAIRCEGCLGHPHRELRLAVKQWEAANPRG